MIVRTRADSIAFALCHDCRCDSCGSGLTPPFLEWHGTRGGAGCAFAICGPCCRRIGPGLALDLATIAAETGGNTPSPPAARHNVH